MATPFRWLTAAALALTAAALALAASPLAAQTFPSKPIRFVVPFPGGFSDVLARQVGAKMGAALGQPVVVENKPGGSGQIGAQEVLRAGADGHTLFMGHIGTHAINPHLFTKLAYDPDKDFAPVTLLVTVPNLLVVHPSVPARTVQELVAYARANPGKLSYASPGNGTSGHLAAELFKSLAKVFIVHIPYRGAAPALQDVMGGQVQLLFDTLAQGYPQARAGKVRALAVGSLKRQPSAPEVPTMDESGFAGWETGPWFGVMVRAGTPDPIVRRLNAELVKALDAPDVRAALAAQGANPVGGSPEAFAAFIRAESARWGKLVRDIGIKAD
jgi:tripartite-type tricarboxylate transporter receptor subunit TctC